MCVELVELDKWPEDMRGIYIFSTKRAEINIKGTLGCRNGQIWSKYRFSDDNIFS